MSDYASQGGYVYDTEDLNDQEIIDYHDYDDYIDDESYIDRQIRTSYYPAAGRDRLYLHILANELGISNRVDWNYINQSFD